MSGIQLGLSLAVVIVIHHSLITQFAFLFFLCFCRFLFFHIQS